MNARKVLNSVLVLAMVLVMVMVLAAMLPLNGGVVAQAQAVSERFAGTVIDPQGNPVTGAAMKVNGVETQIVTLTVIKTGTGIGTVTDIVIGTVVITPGINCGTDCTEAYAISTTVILTATADSGSTFAGWGGDANGSISPVMVTMTANKTVTATFNLIPTYTLSVATTGTGSGTVIKSPTQISYTAGTVVSLTATANTGSTFTGWSGAVVTTTSSVTVTMTANKTVTATFSLKTYTLTMAIVGSGSVSPSVGTHAYPYGTVVPITATPAAGWYFGQWSGDVSGIVTQTTVTINADKVVTATFLTTSPTYYTLTMGLIGAGVITPTVGAHSYVSGTVVGLSASPAAGRQFVSWTGALTSTTNPATITMTANKTVTATFSINTYTLTVAIVGNGLVTPTVGAHAYPYGAVVPITATASTGSTFAGWSGAISGSVNPRSITMTGNKAVTATFQVNSSCDPEFPTATKSLGNGQWNAISNWSNGLPDATKDVIIAHEITVPGVGVMSVYARNLCISQSGILRAVNSHLNVRVTNVLHSYGQILGANGTDATGGPVGRIPATMGKNINVFAATLLNEKTGQIYAGRGGNDITYQFFKGKTIDAKGANGGGINLTVQNKITNHGRIGPRLIDWWEHGFSHILDYYPIYHTDPFNDAATGGNGGDGANAQIYDVRNWNGDGDPTNYNTGNGTGGNGGSIVLNSPSVLNTGRICSGNGGVGVAWYPVGNAFPGAAGNSTINTSNLVNQGMLCTGRGGEAFYEPDMLLAGPDSRIIGDNITLYGGDNFEMQLSDLTEGAITATGSITFAVGQGGVIDLRNNPDNVLKAGEKVKIFADTILLDAGKTLTDTINAPSIVVTSSKILYHAELSGSGQVEARAGMTLSLKFSLLNGAPVSDTYALSVSDSAGWQLGTLPVTMSLGALTSVELTLDVKTPQTMGASDTITVTATSRTDSTVVAKTAVQISLLNYRIFLPVVMRSGS